MITNANVRSFIQSMYVDIYQKLYNTTDTNACIASWNQHLENGWIHDGNLDRVVRYANDCLIQLQSNKTRKS